MLGRGFGEGVWTFETRSNFYVFDESNNIFIGYFELDCEHPVVEEGTLPVF